MPVPFGCASGAAAGCCDEADMGVLCCAVASQAVTTASPSCIHFLYPRRLSADGRGMLYRRDAVARRQQPDHSRFCVWREGSRLHSNFHTFCLGIFLSCTARDDVSTSVCELSPLNLQLMSCALPACCPRTPAVPRCLLCCCCRRRCTALCQLPASRASRARAQQWCRTAEQLQQPAVAWTLASVASSHV